MRRAKKNATFTKRAPAFWPEEGREGAQSVLQWPPVLDRCVDQQRGGLTVFRTADEVFVHIWTWPGQLQSGVGCDRG